MEVYFLERHFAGKDVSEEDHPSDPEEDDIPTCFEETVGVEVFKIGGLFVSLPRPGVFIATHLIGPTHGGERKESR